MLAGKSIDVKAELPSDLEIAFSCRLERSPQVLFEAWTKPEHIRQWWGCEGSRVIHCAIDLRVDGPWSLVMRMMDGSDHPFHGAYREIARPQRLVYTECYDMPQFGRPEWLTTVTFDQLDGATLLTQTLRHKTRAVRDAHLQSGMREGAIQTFTRLSQHTAAIEQTPTPQPAERSKA